MSYSEKNKHTSFIQVQLFIILVVLFQKVQYVNAQISINNLIQFFQATYDENKDGFATIEEITSYFQFVEPQHNIQEKDVKQIFNFFDSNNDKQITLSQLVQIAQIKISYKLGHKQIHIGLTQNQHQMQIMWASNPQSYNKPIVKYGVFSTQLSQTVQANIISYDEKKLGFKGKIYRAVIKNLIPFKRYYYKVGDEETQTYSDVKYFTAPPNKNQHLEQIRIGVFADVGTFMPFGHLVTKQMSIDNFARPFDFIFLTGDIAYAATKSKKVGSFQAIWDLFGQMIESVAAYTPFMPGVGNHENQINYNYTSYLHRYRLPRQTQNQNNFWFSFDYGQLHIIHFSSEHAHEKGSPQYIFLENDLKKARNNSKIQWIIMGAHRAFYASDVTQYAPVTPLARDLQELINLYKVDIIQNGHLHSYQRSWPVFKGKALKQNQNETHYVNPETPIYVIQGTGGALITQKWIDPHPEWSLKRSLKYGYGRITIKANHLKYQFVTLPFGKVIDTWHIIKDPYANTSIKSIQQQK